MARVYDKEKEKNDLIPGDHDSLGTHPERREAEVKDLEDKFNSPSADKSKKLGADDIRAAENGGDDESAEDEDEKDDIEDAVGEKPFRKETRKVRITKKRATVGLIVGVLGGGSLGLMVIFGPILKLESYLSNINNRVFGAATAVVERRLETLFSRYMVTRITELETCGAVRSIDCRADYSNKGIAGRMFAQWQDTRAEERIFNRMGFSLTSNPNASGPGAHRFTLTDRRGRNITLSNQADWDRFKAGQFDGGGRELGREMRKLMNQEFKVREVLQRRSVRKYLERKHNLKLYCFFLCKQRDNVDQKIADVKLKYKTKIIERIVYPMSPKYAFIMGCVLGSTTGGATGNPKCSHEEARRHAPDRSRLTDADIDRIIQRFTDADVPGGKKIGQAIIEELIERIFKTAAQRAAARGALSSAPIVGQIYFALTILDMVDRMDEFIDNNGLGKMAAELNAAQYLEFYTAMRSAGDELKAHELTLDESNVLLQDFNGAEDSRIYQARYGSTQNNVEAYHNADTEYKCKDGEPIPVGEYVCNEKKVVKRFLIEEMRDWPVIGDAIDLAFSNYRRCYGGDPPGPVGCIGIRPRTVVRAALGVVNTISDTVLGSILNGILAVARYIPGVRDFENFVQEQASNFMQWIFSYIFPLPLEVDSLARERYDGMEAGGEFTAFEFCQGGYDDTEQPYGQGCENLTPEESAELNADYVAQIDYEFQTSSLATRLTSLEYSQSLASQMVAALPTSATGAFSMLTSSFTGLFSNFGSNLVGVAFKPAYAATDPIEGSPFGISSYGYRVDDPAFDRNPEVLTPEFCAEAKETWEASRYENEFTGFDEYSETNPCLLEETAVEAGGLFFTND